MLSGAGAVICGGCQLRERGFTVSDAISFEGQVAIVTGSGRGIGRGYALDLARRGAKVVVADIAEEVANEVVAEIEAEGGVAIACTETAATYEGTEAIVAAALEAFGDLHVLINNASTFRMHYFDQLERYMVEDMVNIHVGYIWLTQHAWRVFMKNGYGRVVNTSSSAIFGHAGSANYAFAKAGVIGLTRQLAQESEQYGIKVNAVLPHGKTQDYRPGQGSPGLEKIQADRPDKMHGRVQPGLNAPMVSYLTSRECVFNGRAFEIGNGVFWEVFLGATQGWISESTDGLDAETVADHLDEITSREGYFVPDTTHTPHDRLAVRLHEVLGPYTG